MGDGFLEQRAFFAVADDTPFVQSGWRLFINLFGGFLVRPHVTTLADHRKMQSGFLRHFAYGIRFYFRAVSDDVDRRQTRQRNAILVPLFLHGWF